MHTWHQCLEALLHAHVASVVAHTQHQCWPTHGCAGHHAAPLCHHTAPLCNIVMRYVMCCDGVRCCQSCRKLMCHTPRACCVPHAMCHVPCVGGTPYLHDACHEEGRGCCGTIGDMPVAAYCSLLQLAVCDGWGGGEGQGSGVSCMAVCGECLPALLFDHII